MVTNPFEFIQKQANLHLMAIQDKQNALHEFFDSLSDENLALMGSYTVDLALAQAHEGTYWQGIIEEKLRVRGVCHHCGRDHAADLLGDDHEPTEDKAVAESNLNGTVTFHGPDGQTFTETIVDGKVDVPLWTQPTFEEVTEEQVDAENNIRENATTWGVYFVDPANLQGQVKCGECDTTFISLEDRMLKPPGVKGCGTCQQKAKWG